MGIYRGADGGGGAIVPSGGKMPSYADYNNPTPPIKVDSLQELLSYSPEQAKERISQIREATKRVQAGTRVVGALIDFVEAWEEFLKELMRLRAALSRCEITQARFESQTRKLAAKLSSALASIKESEQHSIEALPSSASSLRDRADG